MRSKPAVTAVAAALGLLMMDAGVANAQAFVFKFGSLCDLSTGIGCVDPDGAGPRAPGDGQFSAPNSVTIDGDGNIYVADSGNNRVQKFDSNGNFLRTFGHWGSSAGEFDFPVALTTDGARNVYVVDQGNHRVQKFDPSGNFLLEFGSFGSADGEFRSPSGVAVDRFDNVYVTSVFKLQKFSSSGALILSLPVGGIVPRAIAVNADGNMVIYDKDNGSINVYSPDGTLLHRFGYSTCDVPSGCWLDPSSNCGCVDPDGAGPLDMGDGQLGIGGTEDLALDQFGNIYVVDPRNARIQKVTPSGAFLYKFGGAGTADGKFGLDSDGPLGIAVDGSGRIYVADTDNARIQVLSQASTTAGAATGAGPVTFTTSAGWFSDLIAVAESALPAGGKPAGMSFPFGLFSWSVAGIPPGATITISITHPLSVASPAQYWKVLGGTWTDLTGAVGDDDGDEVLTLTITDGGVGDADGAVNGQIVDPGGVGLSETVANRQPVANAGDDQILAADQACRAQVRLDGTGSFDPDGDQLTYTWTGPFGTATGSTPNVGPSLGSHSVLLTVDDGHGATGVDTVHLTVEDRTPPDVVSANAAPAVLWPPNHRLVTVDVHARATDNCTAATCRVIGVVSSEPAEGLGDGDVPLDWEVVGPLKVQLRAERGETGPGRVYTILLECTDAAGNLTRSSVTVRVPHDRRGE